MRTGLDRLLSSPHRLAELAGAEVGLLANPTSVTSAFDHAIDALTAAGVRPTRLFGPEHGVRGEAQDMIAVDQELDPISGIPLVSLYGSTYESLAPTGEQLRGLDVMVIDLQDVGARYYTYVYTAVFVARACAQAGIDVLVLDRPNPIGAKVEGPPVSPGFESFVGVLPLPNRHGLTLAEVVRFANVDTTGIRFETLTVEGWSRDTYFDDHDAPWVLPSPNMPTLDTAIVYPGMCLIEGTEVSEGRGTTRPFEIFGAPWVDPYALRHELDALGLPGVTFRPLSFEPTFQKHAGTRCSGLQLHVTDRRSFDSTLTGAAVVWALSRTSGGAFRWRRKAYEFVDQIPAIDLLFGSSVQRELIDAGAPFSELAATLRVHEETTAALARARLPAYE